MRRGLIGMLAAASLWLAAPVGMAQQATTVIQSPILVIDSELLYTGSDYGKRVAQEQEAEKAALSAENRKIEAELAEEERRLTEQRKEMEAADFRKVADAFAKRVAEIRTIQNGKEVALARSVEEERLKFFGALTPVLDRVLSAAGAVVILEKRSTFAASRALDITDRMILEANAIIGDGTSQNTEPEADQ